MKAGDVTPQLLNLADAAVAAHRQAFVFPGVTKEAYLAFVAKVWDDSARKRKIESEGLDSGLTDSFAVALSYACHLAMFGEKEGTSPEKGIDCGIN